MTARLGGASGVELMWTEVFVSACGAPHRLDEFLVGELLEDEAARAGIERRSGKDPAWLHREGNDPGARHRLAQVPDGPDRRTVGEAEVDHEHTRPISVNEAPDRCEVSSLGDHLDAGGLIEQSAQRMAQRGVSVSEHDANRPLR
ncbi:MAG TPA: hypothetical protein VIJ51_03665 [Solirubrobacteraceae bacterium]